MSRISNASQAEVIRPIKGVFLTSKSEIFRLGRRIGVGAEGAVYEIRGRSDLVAKIYHAQPPAEKAEKIEVLSRLGAEKLFNLSAWPVDALRDEPGGAITGFVMKRISEAEELHTLHSPKSRLQKFPEASWAFLIHVASNLARAVAAIHDHGLVIGDLNPKNIMVTRKATVYLLDVDSFQVSANDRTYRCDGGFPEYTPPELQGIAFRNIDRTQEHDYFGLAVVIFQLLFMGRHPFSGNFLGTGEMPLERAIRESRFAYGADAELRQMRQPPGALSLDSIPAAHAEMFRRAFLTSDRPQPREWIISLDALSRTLKNCGLHSGHYYYKELRDCPWCEIEKRARVRLFNFLIPGTGSKHGYFRLDEIWKEIEAIRLKDLTLIPKDNSSSSVQPSTEVEVYARNLRERMSISIMLSAIAGFLIPLIMNFPEAIFLLVTTGMAILRYARAKLSLFDQSQTLFQNQQSSQMDPYLKDIWSINKNAENKVRYIEEKWEKFASDKAYLARLDMLKEQKETYEKLAQIREVKLQQLAKDTSKKRLDEFLYEFDVSHPDIAGIGETAITDLLSHGIETASEVSKERLGQISGMTELSAKMLLGWRRELERKFASDPEVRVTTKARVTVEKEVDSLRVRLEHEISSGAHYLRRMKHDIESNRRRLQPELVKARQELAQAGKNWEVAGKRNPALPIVAIFLLALFFGWKLNSLYDTSVKPDISAPGGKVNAPARPPAPPPPPPPPFPGPVNSAISDPVGEVKSQNAMALYQQGMRFSQDGMFKEAVKAFDRAVEIDPQFGGAYEEMGYALYHLRRYDESIEASKMAIKIYADFTPYYNLGLACMAKNNWVEARDAFEKAIANANSKSWPEKYTLAIEYLEISKRKLSEVKRTP